MSAIDPYPPQNNALFPALHLYPVDDSFIPKRILLGSGQRVKIARPPNTKTQPGERNGYFGSRVLSRQHAEVWEEAGRIYIQDVKSSNGTFINGERLSPEGCESEPCELKTEDILEFGVDIVSEDNSTVLHRKVVARVECVFSNAGGQPPLQQDQFAAGASFNGMNTQRRPQMPMIQQGLAGLGGMGGGVRAPGRGLTLDHIYNRLQAELSKSRDTNHHLQMVAGTLNNVENTLNGTSSPEAAPPQFPDRDALPSVQPPRAVSVPTLPTQVPLVDNAHEEALAELQAQLREHQRALAAHVQSIRALEDVLAEQEAMKREVRELREFVGVDRRRAESASGGELDGELEEELEEDGDDSDARSDMTAVPIVLQRIEEEEEETEQNAEHEVESERACDVDSSNLQATLREEREENILRQRAQTPEPTLEMSHRSPAPSPPPAPAAATSPSALSLSELTARLAQLTEQLGAALAASSVLQKQHASAEATIAALEEKLARLEARAADVAPPPVSAPAPAPVPSTNELEALQVKLAAMHAELSVERERREAWAGLVDEHIRLANSNGWVEAKPVAVEAAEAPLGRSRSQSVSRSPYLRLEALNLGLDVGSLKPELLVAAPALLGSGMVKSEVSSMAQIKVQTAFGVVLLGIAAAAVLWRVKPE